MNFESFGDPEVYLKDNDNSNRGKTPESDINLTNQRDNVQERSGSRDRRSSERKVVLL